MWRGALPPALLVLVLGMSAVGCGDAELGCQEGVLCEGDVRVATWWSGSNPAFLVPLRTSLEQRTTVTLDHRAADSKDCHLQRVDDVMRAAGSAPRSHPGSPCGDVSPEELPFDAVLLNNGQDVLSRSACVSQKDYGFRALEAEFPRGWFAEAYPPDVVATLGCRGHVYGVPIGLHRINHVVYNQQLFDKAGYGSPAELKLGLDQLLEVAEKIQGVLDSEGRGGSVFAVPIGDKDALSLFFIENVMLAFAGNESYLDYWAGCPVPDGLFASALERVQRLSAFFKPTTSAAALGLVMEGNAAMFVTGDWNMANAVESEGMLGSMPFPGTQQHWVYSADVFALPTNGNASKGLAWLHAISDHDVQREFAESKYAIPARWDVAAPDIEGDPRHSSNLIRALPALLGGNGVFRELAAGLEQWARSLFGDTSSLVAYAEAEYQSLVEQRLAGSADPTSRLCQEATSP